MKQIIKLTFFFILSLLLSLTSYSQTPSERNNPIPYGTTTAPMGYFEYLPTGYESSPAKSLPLVIFLHGMGEMGNGTTDLDTILAHGPPKLVENNSKDFPFILLCPQTSKEWYYVTPTLNDFIQYAKSNYKVDPSRIYVTGLSMGGAGTWYYAADYPDQVAAIVPICGPGEYWAPCKYKNIGVWAFHNAHDPRIPVDKSIQMIDSIKSCGGTPLLTVYDAYGHDAWSVTYRDDKMWEWLLNQKKGGLVVPANQFPVVDTGADITINLPNNSTSISATASDPDGTIKNYFWEKLSGPTVTMNNFDSSTFSLSKLQEGTYHFRVIATDNQNAAAVDEIYVFVKGGTCDNMDLSPTIVPSKVSPSCSGEVLILSIPEKYDHYQWSTGDTTQSIEVRERGYYSFVGSFKNGCTSSSAGYEALFVPMPSKPVVSLQNVNMVNDSAFFCAGQKVKLSAPSGYLSYKWSNGNTAREIEVDQPGTYFVEVQNTSDCVVGSDSISLYKVDVPGKPEIIYNGLDSLSSSINAQKYNWFLNGKPIGNNARKIKVDHLGETYTLAVENYGCDSELSSSFVPLGDVEGFPNDFKIVLNPNPSEGIVYLKITPSPTDEVLIALSDLSGKVVLVKRFVKGSFKSRETLHLNDLSKGIYFLKVQEGERSVVKRLIKY